jgi:hypothetical protein
MGGPHGEKIPSFPAPDTGPEATDVLRDDPGEAEPMTFVIRLWREGDKQPGGRTWRGRVTHVESGDWRGVQTVEDVAAFVREVAAG